MLREAVSVTQNFRLNFLLYNNIGSSDTRDTDVPHEMEKFASPGFCMLRFYEERLVWNHIQP